MITTFTIGGYTNAGESIGVSVQFSAPYTGYYKIASITNNTWNSVLKNYGCSNTISTDTWTGYSAGTMIQIGLTRSSGNGQSWYSIVIKYTPSVS
jgi:hypothetical protein